MSLTTKKENDNCKKIAYIINKNNGKIYSNVYINLNMIDEPKKNTTRELDFDSTKYEIISNYEKIKNQNYRVVISAPSGSGKSTVTNLILINLCKNEIIPEPEYLKYSKEQKELLDLPQNTIYVTDEDGNKFQNPNNLQGTIFLFTALTDDDNAFEKTKYNGRIFRKIIISEEIESVNINDLKNCICVFDDAEDHKDKNLTKKVYALIDEILTKGRKLNIHLIFSGHNLKQYKLTSYINLEANVNVFFQKATSESQLASYLKSYIGIDKNEIEKIKDAIGRYVIFSRIVPRYCISKNKIWLI